MNGCSFFIMFVIPVIIIGLVFLGIYIFNYILKKIFKPNEKYLKEFEYMKFKKVIKILFICIVLLSYKFPNLVIYGYLILFTIDMLFDLNYLKSKDNAKRTKLYLISQYSLVTICLALVILLQ